MKKSTVLLFILNISFSSTISFRQHTMDQMAIRSTVQRLKRSSDDETFDLSTIPSNFVRVHNFYFQQTLDHFNAIDDRKWNQNYWVTATFHKKFGPAFLFINGQHHLDETSGFGFSDTFLLYARRLNAICFSLEHRFYGKIPPLNGSLIDHLSTAQALADTATFIKGTTKEFHLPENTKWIVFGASYGGSLAAWARLRYPTLIHGAVISSAALLAKVDYNEYDQIVEESLNSYDPNCVESIKFAFEQISHLNNNTQNIQNISQMFYLDYDDPPSDMNIVKRNILYTMINIIYDAVQYNDIIQLNIPLICGVMIGHNGTKLEALAEIGRIEWERKDRIEKNPESQNFSGMNFNERIWTYQRCSELGFFSSRINTTYLSAVEHLFTPIELDIKNQCEPFFGLNYSVEDLNKKIINTNSQYGGLDINISNAIFIHGSLDPWYKAGIYKKSKNTSLYEAIFIKGASHCADLNPPSDKDIPELKNARNKILKTLRIWLGST